MKRPDSSPKISQRDKFSEELVIKERFQFTDKQKEIINQALDKSCRCIYIDGIWGSGKSYLSIYLALKLLNLKKIEKIYYIRNPVESSSTGKIGFLKGDNTEKMAPYNAVFYSKLEELLTKTEINKLEKDERIECIPLGFVRGASWNCAAVIVDEASSMTWDDLLLLMSRCGEFTRIFLIGDSKNQNDIGAKSGFRKLFDLFNDEDSKKHGIYTYELYEKNDILRSGFLRYVMEKIGKIKK